VREKFSVTSGPRRSSADAALQRAVERLGGVPDQRERVRLHLYRELPRPFGFLRRGGGGERQRERRRKDGPMHLRHWFNPDTMRAAPAAFPVRISLMSATASCSSATLSRSASKRLACACSLAGSC